MDKQKTKSRFFEHFDSPPKYPAAIEWLRQWRDRLDTWAQKDDLPVSQWRGVLWPSPHEQSALMELKQSYPIADLVTHALMQADRALNGHPDDLADWLGEVHYRLREFIKVVEHGPAAIDPAMAKLIQTGTKISSAASKGGKGKKKDHAAMRRRCDELRRQRPELSANGIDKTVADEFGVSFKTVQRARKK